MNTNFKEISRIRGFLDIEEIKFLNRLAKKTVDQFGKESTFCEIGSFCGKSTISIARALKEKEGGVLHAIDWHQGSYPMPDFGTSGYTSTYQEFLGNLEKYSVKSKVNIIVDKSEDSVEKVPEKLHFLWIDGAHEYESVKADFNNYSPKIVEGGYLSFHDACWTTWTGPFQVINEYLLDNEDFNLYALIGNTMVFKKEKNRTSPALKKMLRKLCVFVSGEKRAFHKKIVSFIFFRLTKLYTITCHNWNS